MLLSDLRILGEEGEKDILIGNEQITAVYDPANRPAGDQVKRLASDPANRPASDPAVLSLSFPGAIAFPGLINSHDHLDFNLFPASGYKIYGNYTEWGRDIHEKNAAGIRAVLKIPLHLRTRWGLYKNLLNGFTTVVNHGEKLMTGDEPVTVFQDYHCLHSVGFEKNWKWLLNRPSGRGLPFVVHVGEGTDKAAGREIDRLVHWNLFKRPLIGVHGVAMNEAQAAFFKALVWCPASNYFLLGQTAPVDRLKEKTSILFGTDSTLTAGWNSWDQIRLARKEKKVTDRELLDMLTKGAAAVWGFPNRGEIGPGQRADLVIARPGAGAESMDAFYGLNPEDFLLVLHKGKIRLYDESVSGQLSAGGLAPKGFCKIMLNDRCKYVEGNLPGLMKEIRVYNPEQVFPSMFGMGPEPVWT